MVACNMPYKHSTARATGGDMQAAATRAHLEEINRALAAWVLRVLPLKQAEALAIQAQLIEGVSLE